ncbi:MAG TPA: peptide-methionine (S)-S-oxide reductase MsrA [Candidatus Paceibacterota bacterium]|nr:peptide-methionine (S)-S-oxide reductase MsrA [Candidatus Paceibacterota bacterium]
MENKTQVVVFAGGCFWCTEAIFRELKGVVSVMPGYAGGTTKNPTYEQVCTGKTGHAEATHIEYDPSKILFGDLLTVFFATHDPTTMNRQGNDVGTQYRSAVFYVTPEQKTETEKFITELAASDPSGKPVVTEVAPLDAFYPAEDYHRNYYKKNSFQPYCQLIIEPKVEKLQNKFAELLKNNTDGEKRE